MKKIIIKLFFLLEVIFLWIIPIKDSAEIFTRQDILNRTTNYTNLIFTPSVDTARIYDYKGNWIKPTFKRSNPSSQPQAYFEAGKSYIGEAYVWGGIDGWQEFSSRIFSNVCPGGYNTSKYGYWIPGNANSGSAARRYLAGIDCASFVNQCLNLDPTQGIRGLREQALKINKDNMKPADILVSAHHTALSVYGDASKVVQSISSYSYPPPHVTQVYGWPSGISYEAYSIFPQFSSPDISYNKDTMNISVDIAVNARYGRVHKDSVKVRVDGKEVNDFTFKSLGNGRYKVKSSKGFVLSRDHILEIRADNEELRNRYRDTESQLQIITIE